MSARLDKVNTAIRKEVAELVLRRMRDPRLTNVTITAVEVNRDLSVATVHVSALGGPEQLQAAVAALRDAAGWVRRQLASVLTMRTVPELDFVADDSARRAQRLEELFREHHRETGDEES
ncbi:MAG: 30S ribosome-binding factor RbfA [Fimbriimonadaceae bacterium]|nr:30S ribosome-binding factor RbfA [Fimbriimonadaceae bacterium]